MKFLTLILVLGLSLQANTATQRFTEGEIYKCISTNGVNFTLTFFTDGSLLFKIQGKKESFADALIPSENKTGGVSYFGNASAIMLDNNSLSLIFSEYNPKTQKSTGTIYRGTCSKF